MSEYHIPVLLEESIKGLNINPAGTYIDATYGGGGHSTLVHQQLTTGKLIAFDKDGDSLVNQINADNFVLIHHDFIYMKNFLKEQNILKVDGILLDLGVSSHQFDTAERGFSFRHNAFLDMRMDQDASLTAAEILNNYPEDKLASIFKSYGEIFQAKKLARMIMEERKQSLIETTFRLLDIIDKCLSPGPKKNKIASQVFQSLRIAVNDELNALKTILTASVDLLNKNGRLVILSYHSLEDRLVKNFLRSGNFEGTLDKDIFGNVTTPFKEITKHPIVPGEVEIDNNNRARSARLRIGERIYYTLNGIKPCI